MTMKPILEVQAVSKKFKIRHEAQPYLSLRESLWPRTKGYSEDFWALNDVSFDVQPGESIGIIGKNGAGKSTLLKIFSRITPPTKGKVIGRGRVASLLEVGTGFHPELTGRENVYLNGSILGMRKREIDRQFDAIVSFAGTERFLDTPLKFYSSGMQLRLAFAVAAFLEPEILLIDEVLAVGDAEFQRKCLGKMEDVTRSGRTIIFVSHNMAAIETLCKTAIMLKDGKVAHQGPSQEITRAYLQESTATQEGNLADQRFERNEKKAQITRLEFFSNGRPATTLYMGDDLQVKAHVRTELHEESYMLGLVLRDMMGTPVLLFNNKNYNVNFERQERGELVISVQVGRLNLMPGSYLLDVHFASQNQDLDVKRNCVTFQVVYKAFEGAGEPLREEFNKVFYSDVRWTLERKG